MPLFAPDYYKNFICKAGKCRHSCCIGWEIEIDDATLSRYKKETGALGARLSAHISEEGNAHFVKGTNGRCPFLSTENLCDIILTFGEGALCDICRDHPRYRNFLPTRTEIGLGLACEEAARLILEGEGRYGEICLSGEEIPPEGDEALFFALRDGILELLFDETCTAKEAFASIRAAYGIAEADADFYTLYKNMPHLYPSWEAVLEGFSHPSAFFPDMPARRLCAYFVHRHLAGGTGDGRWRARIAFCLHAAESICLLSPDAGAFPETARRYSEEIEYSEENVETLLSALDAV